MKKILRVVAITSTVMVVILGVFLWNMNRLSKQKAAKQEKLLAQERDLLPESRQKALHRKSRQPRCRIDLGIYSTKLLDHDW